MGNPPFAAAKPGTLLFLSFPFSSLFALSPFGLRLVSNVSTLWRILGSSLVFVIA
jgi:hypothetical protein